MNITADSTTATENQLKSPEEAFNQKMMRENIQHLSYNDKISSRQKKTCFVFGPTGDAHPPSNKPQHKTHRKHCFKHIQYSLY